MWEWPAGAHSQTFAARHPASPRLHHSSSRQPPALQGILRSHSGVYFRSTGWIERGQNLEQVSNPALSKSGNASVNLKDLIDRYGEDNGRYLYEQFTEYQQHYRQLTYIETGLEPDDRFECSAREEATRRGWCFEKIQGNLALLAQLVSGNWPEKDFLIVGKGYRIKATYGEDVIGLEEGQAPDE